MRASMSALQTPGKTAPRLVLDIRHYDPTHPPASGRNLLSQVPPVFAEGYHGPQEYISPRACDHQYVTQVNQTALAGGNLLQLSAICSKCRRHLQIAVDSSTTVSQHVPSPGHIHHLVYKGGRQIGTNTPEEVTWKGQNVELFYYECSNLACPTRVSVSVASPILTDYSLQLLTDPEFLRKRAEEAIASHPNRLEGMGPPLAIDVLMNLRTYITNALQGRNRPISAINKRFMCCFGVEGEPCRDLLEFLGFTYKDEGFWEPPRLETSMELPYRDAPRVFLDDVCSELSTLIEQRPPSEKRGNQVEQHGSAYDDMLYLLGSRGYPKSTRANEFQMPSTPCYEDLGVVEDMASTSIIEAFHRQVSVDPTRTPLYLKCLKTIGYLRGGQDGASIDYAVQEAYDEGEFTDDDVFAAFAYFGLRPDDPYLTDDTIIGKFHAFLKDTAHENESRRQLWRIGDYRQSEQIKAASEDRVSTVEQAKVFLGVEDTTADDFVIPLYTAKITDAPSTKDLAKRAVELIAQHRNSALLKRFVETGDITTDEMDVAEAYRILQIPDRTADEGSIVAAYTICVDEAPQQAELYHRALKTIASESNSHLLNDMVSGPESQSDHGFSDWPVGLQNIGNTCYLNSLLQFYFSVRPFREMVLEFERFKMELSGDTLSRKQVGSRKVLRKEIERSQSFVRELRGLFYDMIKSPQSFVTPRQELARLTLISPSNEAAIRRRSTLSHTKPAGLGEINGMPVLGPLGPPQITTEGDARRQSAGGEVTDTEKLSQAALTEEPGEATPASDTMDTTNSSIPKADDKENEPPSSDITMNDAPNAQSSSAPNPGDPPPVPPRPAPEADRERQLREEVEIGAQQDVTEAINNVLFQSQCAVQPAGFSPDGEQLDRVKDLFYGRSKSYISAEAGIRSKEEWWCDIKVDVAAGMKDIYAAVDGAFDAQKIIVDNSVAEQFSAISKLPPVLQIQVQRVQFDPVKKSSFKSTHHLDLKETIYLDRYMDTNQSDFVNLRRENWELKNSLNRLEARRGELLREHESNAQDMPKLFDNVQGVLDDLDSMKDDPETAGDKLDVEPELLSELGKVSDISRSELYAVEQEIQSTKATISGQFDDPKYRALPYRLYAVFIHRGTVNFGHYWIYIFDFTRNIWRKYNDTYVTEVSDTAEIFGCKDERNPPTPYFLVYVHDRIKDMLASPVCREIVKGQPEAPPEGGFFHEWDTAAASAPTPAEGEGQTAESQVNDVDMEPPAYGESGGSNAPGTGGMLDATTITPGTGPNPLKRKSFDDSMNVDQLTPNPS